MRLKIDIRDQGSYSERQFDSDPLDRPSVDAVFASHVRPFQNALIAYRVLLEAHMIVIF